jgi:GNAT superfamily N-acetyltransferase
VGSNPTLSATQDIDAIVERSYINALPCGVINMLDSNVWVRALARRDKSSVFRMLSFLGDAYPGGLDWLDRRIEDVEVGAGHCMIAGVGCWLGGIIIDTPKGPHTSKISTLYVRAGLRGKGVGSMLIQHQWRRWQQTNIDNVYITVSEARVGSLEPFLSARQFNLSAVAHDRYRLNNAEHIYSAAVN